MNQQVLMKKIKQMQDEMIRTQQEIEETVFYASAGGVVSVEVYGTKHLKAIKVEDDFEVSSKEDIEMLNDMIVAACNQAYKEIDNTTKEKMAKYQSFLGGFGGMF
mgnify:CR=1 FL=1